MRTPLDQHIIDEIRKKRNSLEMSQEAFSEKMGFKSNSFVASAESPKSTKKYNVSHLNKAALILKCRLWDLLPEEPFPDQSLLSGTPKNHKE